MQEAAFFENTDYSRNPFCNAFGVAGLARMYRERYKMTFDLEDWPNTLIRMAIPYATKCITVICPDRFKVSSEVLTEAADNKLKVWVIPHSSLPKSLLQKSSRQYFSHPVDKDGVRYPLHVQRILGEKDDANRHLVPDYIKNYGTIAAYDRKVT